MIAMKSNPPLAETLAAQRFASLSRRHFLRGLGACVALPTFESLLHAGPAAEAKAAGDLARTATGAPLRMGFVYFPNGAILSTGGPRGEGKDFDLTRTRQPLKKVNHQLKTLGGMNHEN